MNKSIGIVAIARLENDYINEWIQHHIDIGVNHIYVYDNSSSSEEKLNGTIHEKYLNRVTIIPAYDKNQYQMPAYKDAYYKYGNMHDYLMYIDIDEFVMLQKDKNIKDFINRFPYDCECYRMNWELYGDNEIINRDISGSVVDDFKKIALKQRRTTTKSIIKCGLNNIDFISVHYAIYNKNGIKNNLKTYYGDFIDITEKLPINEKSLNIHLYDYTFIKLNHYITKSISEFICQKMRRPDAAWNYERNIDKDFFQYNTKTKEKEDFFNNSQRVITYYYWSPKLKHDFENAGDYFNKVLMNKIYNCICKSETNENYIDIAMCGSVLASKKIRNAKYILGCGFQNSNPNSNNNCESYYAVRGKLSEDRLIERGLDIDVKKVDPGIMVSMLYNFDNVKKKYNIGIIPHYVDEECVKNKYKTHHIISMKTTDIQQLCRDILQCEIILSSSLHGIIFAHSLGVPAYHIELNKLQEGDNFKFKDYYSSYDNVHYELFKCDNGIPFESIIEYDNKNRKYCNPSKSEIEEKQNDFLSVLPYRENINKKYLKKQYERRILTNNNPVFIQESDNKKLLKIQKLKDDIANGRVIRVPYGSGFIWERVK